MTQENAEVFEDGTHDGDFEDSEIIADLMEQRDELQAQVDELLAAARHLLSNAVFPDLSGKWEASFVEGTDLTEYCQPLHDVISKITGETK